MAGGRTQPLKDSFHPNNTGPSARLTARCYRARLTSTTIFASSPRVTQRLRQPPQSDAEKNWAICYRRSISKYLWAKLVFEHRQDMNKIPINSGRRISDAFNASTILQDWVFWFCWSRPQKNPDERRKTSLVRVRKKETSHSGRTGMSFFSHCAYFNLLLSQAAQLRWIFFLSECADTAQF